MGTPRTHPAETSAIRGTGQPRGGVSRPRALSRATETARACGAHPTAKAVARVASLSKALPLHHRERAAGARDRLGRRSSGDARSARRDPRSGCSHERGQKRIGRCLRASGRRRLPTHPRSASGLHRPVPPARTGSRRALERMERWSPARGADEEAAAARLRATSHAMDPHPRRTALVSQLALQVFDALVATGAMGFGDPGHAAFCRPPPSFTRSAAGSATRPGRRPRATSCVRSLHRPGGRAPTGNYWHSSCAITAARSPKERTAVSPDSPGGARKRSAGWRACSAWRVRCAAAASQARPRLRADTTSTGVRLRVVGAVDTQANATRLASAKHLLDRDSPTATVHRVRQTHRIVGSPASAIRRVGGDNV